MLSAKDGCSPSGQCGCCTVLVDGKAIVSCNLSLEKVEGAEITTLEGHRRGPSATAWPRRSRRPARCSAASARPASSCAPRRCSRRRAPSLDRDTAARHLGAHLCRCTGYVKILDAVELLAKGESPQPVAARRRRHERHPLPGPRPRARGEALRRRPRASTACSTARSTSPPTRAPTCVAHRHERGGRGRPASSRVFTGRRRPRRAAGRA